MPQRDSNVPEWMKFVELVREHVIVIPDYEDDPISLLQRMELYAHAKMNFFVNNGPCILCILSEAPYICMRTIGGDDCLAASPHRMKKFLGITPGFQYPWANRTQYLSYLDDTCNNIQKEWTTMGDNIRITV